MTLRDTPLAYGTISRINHWVGGALVIALLAIGLYFHEMPRGDERTYWRGLHIGLGALIILPLAFRVLWRSFTSGPQALPQKPWLQWSSRLMHALLLALVAVLIITGPLTVWSTGKPMDVLGWFQLASPMPRLPALHEALEVIHKVASRVLLIALIVHVVAGLYHALFVRDGRMWGRAHRLFVKP